MTGRVAIAAALAVLALPGCATVAGFDQAAKVDRVALLKAEGETPWTFDFSDPTFADILQRADLGALDVKAALARAAAADAVAQGVAADAAPSASLGLQGARAIPGQGVSTAALGWSVNGSWSPDFTGRLSAAIAAARADARAAGLDVSVARASVGAEAARTYLAIRAADDRLTRLARRIADEERAKALVDQRFAAGLIAATEPLARRQTLAGFVQDSAQTREQRARAVARLRALLGSGPTMLEIAPAGLNTLADPSAPSTIDTAALEKRLDVRIAALRLEAADERRLEAVRAALPRVAIGLSGSASASAGIDALQRRAATLTPSLGIETNLFDGGRSRARRDQATAEATGAEIAYLRTRLTAETALTDFVSGVTSLEARAPAVRDSFAAAQAQSRLSQLRFEAGRESRLESLDAQRNVIDAEERLAELQRERLEFAIAREALLLGLDGAMPQNGSLARQQ